MKRMRHLIVLIFTLSLFLLAYIAVHKIQTVDDELATQQPSPSIKIGLEEALLEVDTCKLGRNKFWWNFGSGTIWMRDRQHGNCIIDIRWEIEMGWMGYHCNIPSDEKTLSIFYSKGATNEIFKTQYCNILTQSSLWGLY